VRVLYTDDKQRYRNPRTITMPICGRSLDAGRMVIVFFNNAICGLSWDAT